MTLYTSTSPQLIFLGSRADERVPQTPDYPSYFDSRRVEPLGLDTLLAETPEQDSYLPLFADTTACTDDEITALGLAIFRKRRNLLLHNANSRRPVDPRITEVVRGCERSIIYTRIYVARVALDVYMQAHLNYYVPLGESHKADG